MMCREGSLGNGRWRRWMEKREKDGEGKRRGR